MSQYSSWADVKRRMREIREEQGLTQSQVAESVGISQARVSQIERGEIHNPETMRTCAEALGAKITVTIEYGDRTVGAA
ncbi:helix-turn-helix domain-containing protein [Streptomyces fuscichromogenes]|uniref:helix-turn-helix domain-containing protein n=1 Tax=Streptomyces fuscichromogenes TaxID=1324013 RepID=UPI003807E604